MNTFQNEQKCQNTKYLYEGFLMETKLKTQLKI